MQLIVGRGTVQAYRKRALLGQGKVFKGVRGTGYKFYIADCGSAGFDPPSDAKTLVR